MIIWNFKGVDTKFRSTPAKHERDIFKMAKACGVPPETEIIYHHGNPNKPTIADTFAVDGNTTDTTEQAVPKPVKATKPRRKKTTKLRNVSGDVDSTSASSNSVADTNSNGSDSSGSDSLAD